jgi:membrane associated rhomboid family serine protease
MFDNINPRSVTFNLIVANVVLFALCHFHPELNGYLSLHYFFNKHDFLHLAYIGAANTSQFAYLQQFAQEAYAYNLVGNFLPIQIISHMFMHGSGAHIFFNMFGLFMFGSILERVWGPQRFLLFYIITGFGAVLLHMFVQGFLVYRATGVLDPTMAMLEAHPQAMSTYFSNTVGASGAIFGVLTAFAVLFPNTELYLMFIPVPVKAKYMVSVYILIELWLGVGMYGGDNVAHFAHLGGALFGFLLVKYWNRNRNTFY